MEVDLKKVVLTIMYYFPNPTTEVVERLVWVYERNQNIITLIFEWDDETGFIPISPDVRKAMDELMVGKHIRRTNVAENTTGNEDWRNYKWAIVEDPKKSIYYDPKVFERESLLILRHLWADHTRLLQLIADTKNSVITKSEMYHTLTEEFRVKSMIKPKRAKGKTAK